MAKVNYLKNRFSSGELTPKMLGRGDLPQYQAGCQILENFLPMVHGGIVRRPGMRHVNETKKSDKKSRLIPFIHSNTSAYMLEFGDLYIRVYKSFGTQSGAVQIDNSSSTVTIMTGLPAAPTVNDLTTGDTTPKLTGTVTLDYGSKIEVTIDSVTYAATYDPIAGTWSYQVASPLAEGTYTVTATVTNSAGSTADGTGTLVVDAGLASTISIVSAGFGETSYYISAPGTVESNAFLAMVFDNGDKVGVFPNTVSLPYPAGYSPYTDRANLLVQDGATGQYFAEIAWYTVQPPNYKVPIQEPQTITFQFGTVDANGVFTIVQSQITTLYKANYIPSAVSIATVENLTVATYTPILRGTCPDLKSGEVLSVMITTDTTPKYYTVGDGVLFFNAFDKSWILQVPAGAYGDDGTYSIVAMVTDVFGNTSTAEGVLTIDAPAPGDVTVTALITNDTTPTITGTATAGAGETLRVKVNNVTYVDGDGNLTHNNVAHTWALVIPTALADGTYTVLAELALANGTPVADSASYVEITTTYTEAQLDDISYVQESTTMYLCHPDHAPATLTRTSDISWLLATLPIVEDTGDFPVAILTLSSYAVAAGVTATASAASFIQGDVGRVIQSGNGRATITGYTSSTVVTCAITTEFTGVTHSDGNWSITGYSSSTVTPNAVGPVGGSITLTASDSVFKDLAAVSHVGKYVDINGGLAQISAIGSATVSTATVIMPLSISGKAMTGKWAIKNAKTMWPSGQYPKAVTMYEQRLVFGNILSKPQTVWCSKNGSRVDFTFGTAAADGMTFTLSTDRGAPIQHLLSTKLILALTYGAEMTIGGSQDKPLAPDNLQIRTATNHGASFVKPFKIGSQVFFAQRGRQRLRAMDYEFATESYQATDITLLSDHIAGSGFKELAYSQEPYPIIWGCVIDGAHMATCTFDKSQTVQAWARQVTNGQVESVAVVPNGTDDQVWTIVRRVIGGVAKRYIEVLDRSLNTDSALVRYSAVGNSTFNDLYRLEGMLVDVVADGSAMTPATVTNGTITIDRIANVVEIGLHYDSTLIDMPVELNTPSGSAFGSAVSVNEVIVRVHETVGLEINGEAVPFRTFGPNNFNTIQPFTGDKRIVTSQGWESNGMVAIRQVSPLPCEILAVVKKVTVND